MGDSGLIDIKTSDPLLSQVFTWDVHRRQAVKW